MTRSDLIVIGAGPAGMAAAMLAAQQGMSVLVLDENPAPGGQIYRNLATSTATQRAVMGPDYAAGLPLIDGLTAAPLTVISSAVVWDVDQDCTVTYSKDGQAYRAKADHLLLCTGATERPVPLPGWTLPGVMTAGAAQILMKTSGLLCKDAVLAGSGPLLYLVAVQMVQAGTPPKALVETQTPAHYRAALRHAVGALRGWKTLAKGARMLRDLRRAAVPRYTAASDLAITGDTATSGLRFTAQGQAHHLECTTVLLHQGVVPNTQITRALRLDHRWHAGQRCFHPSVSEWGQSSHPQIYIAGDGAAIGGARAAEHAGQCAAADILRSAGRITTAQRDVVAASAKRNLARERALRPFLDALYAPPAGILQPPDEVIVCRCEDVTAGDIRAYARLGCKGPSQTKAFGRAGMGPCQGRSCGLTVTELLAQATGQNHQDTGYFRIRAPLKPVTLGEVAALHSPAPSQPEGQDP
jgi:octopine oxidase subunit A